MKTQALTTKRLVLTALLAALTTAGSALRITLPIDIAGTTSFHLGNILCALSGILLGPWLGGLAAGLGSAIYDMLNPLYISECWITFLTKGLYALAAGLVAWKLGKPWNAAGVHAYSKAVLASITGAISYAVIYLAKSYFYNGLLLSGLTTQAAALNLLGKLPATTFNIVVAVIGAPLLAIAINKALKSSHLSLE